MNGHLIVDAAQHIYLDITCDNESDVTPLIEAIDEAINYDEKILVEKVIENLCELNCSVVGDNNSYETSLIEEVYGSYLQDQHRHKDFP